MIPSIIILSALVFLVVTTKVVVVMSYDQSLEDCWEVASHFRNTCDNSATTTTTTTTTPPPTSVESLPGETFTCPNKPRCIEGGTTHSGSTDCTWIRKLCVTCRVDENNSGKTLIRVQTNNLPDHCVASSSIKAKNFDYEVPFNPKHEYGVWKQTFQTQAELNRAVCPIRKTTTQLAGTAAAVEFGDAESAQAMGFAINGVAYQFANQIREDPVYPISILNEQPLDTCLGHNQRNSDSGMYHYHDLSPCLFSSTATSDDASMGSGSCKDHPECSKNITEWSLAGYSSTVQTKTIIGISKDGHVMYGPYNQEGELWEPSEVDACNGAWSSTSTTSASDDDRDYFYVGTRWHPYLAGCQGPANFPQLQQDQDDPPIYAQCSLNGMDQYHDTTTSNTGGEDNSGSNIEYARGEVPSSNNNDNSGMREEEEQQQEQQSTTQGGEDDDQYKIEVFPTADGCCDSSAASPAGHQNSLSTLMIMPNLMIFAAVVITALLR